MPQRANRFWTVLLTTVLVDVLRFTLAYNPEGAMSFSLGPSSRWWFVFLSLGTLFVLGYMYRQTPREDRFQIASIALICGGAVGNLLDRLRWARGVVDFIDIGVGTHRFWTFNFADLAVTLGTAMLTWILCVRAAKEERRTPALAPSQAFDEPN